MHSSVAFKGSLPKGSQWATMLSDESLPRPRLDREFPFLKVYSHRPAFSASIRAETAPRPLAGSLTNPLLTVVEILSAVISLQPCGHGMSVAMRQATICDGQTSV